MSPRAELIEYLNRPRLPGTKQAQKGTSHMKTDFEWALQFTRPKRGYPKRLILDGFGADFFIMFDFDDCPEYPATHGTCDVQIVPLMSDDPWADAITVISNANRPRVMRFLAALGIERFDDKTKAAFYEP